MERRNKTKEPEYIYIPLHVTCIFQKIICKKCSCVEKENQQNGRRVCGCALRTVPAGSLTSPIKAGKSVVTADLLPGPSDTFKLIY